MGEAKQQRMETKKFTFGGKESFVGNPVQVKQAESYDKENGYSGGH